MFSFSTFCKIQRVLPVLLQKPSPYAPYMTTTKITFSTSTTQGNQIKPTMTELDNLEYYIKFPSSNQQCHLVKDEKPPLMILFGWAGCADKYLAKYSQIYEEMGLITLRYTAPVKYIFWKPRELPILGERIVKLLVDMNFENHPIFVHTFSNGGANMYRGFSQAHANSQIKFQLKGVIFDSTPGKSLLGVFRALSSIIGGNFFYRFPLVFMMTIFFGLSWFIRTILSYIMKREHVEDSFAYLNKEPNVCPQHFIYSKADDMIPYKCIESFMQLRRSLGVPVTSIRFESSTHVRHYYFHKEEYTRSVYDFIEKCLRKAI